MLGLMRKYSKSWLIKILLFFIVSVFMFWGVGSLKSNSSFNVAVINGESISLREYNKEYFDIVENYKKTNGVDSVPQKMSDNLKKIALDRLINHKLFLQQAVEIDLQITNQELIKSIQSIPVFLINGTFDASHYHNVLNEVKITSEDFENSHREFLLIEKFINFFCGTVKVSNFEILNYYSWYNSLINLSYVFFDADKYKDVRYDFKELCDYFEEHKKNYKIDGKNKINYVVFNPDNYLKKKDVEEALVIEYFNSNKEMFEVEKTVDVSHILIKTDINSEYDERFKNLAIKISKLAKEGADFLELAKSYSECPSGKDGGRLGVIEYNAVVEPFANKAFSMFAGEISSPVKTKFGWHVIKVNSIIEARVKTLEEVETQIKTILDKENANSYAYDEAIRFIKKCFSDDDFIVNAKLNDIEVLETDWFSEKDNLNEFGSHSEFVKSLSMFMKVGQISDIYEFEGKYFIIQLLDKVDSKFPTLEEVKSKVIVDFESYKRLEKAKKDAKCLVEAILVKENSFDNAIELHNMELKNTGFFAIGDPNSYPNIKKEILVRLMTGLFKEGEITKEPIICDNGVYVACLDERKKAMIVEEDKNKIAEALLASKQHTFLIELIKILRSDSTIEISSDYL